MNNDWEGKLIELRWIINLKNPDKKRLQYREKDNWIYSIYHHPVLWSEWKEVENIVLDESIFNGGKKD